VCKALNHHVFRLFVIMMQTLGVLRLEVRNAHRLRREGLLVVANHPSLIDVVLLISRIRRADCVVKSALANNPFTRGPVRGAAYVCNDSGAGVVDDCIASVRAGNNLVIFPEGTRTSAGAIGDALRLQRGAANIAVRGGIDLTPVIIRCEPPTLARGDKWYKVPHRRVRYVIDVREDIAVAPFIREAGGEALAARAMTRALNDYFAEEIRRADA
jgi:1-acyl-sn-glycerol-3-phosphate acyltransferase